MQDRASNNRAGKIKNMLNHGFDGDARKSGATPDELYAKVKAKLDALGATPDEVLLALSKAEGTHAHLLGGDKLDNAQGAIHDFLDRYVADMNRNDGSA